MAISGDIYLRMTPAKNDPSSMERGMRMGQMYNQKREGDAINEVMKRNTTVGEDGVANLDRAKTLSELTQMGYGQRAQALGKQFQEQDMSALQAKATQLEALSGLAGSATDQATYDNALAQAGKMGLDTSSMPRQYDPRLVSQIQRSAMSGLEQLKLDQNERMMREQRDERRYQHGVQRTAREEEKTNQQVEKLQGKLSPLQDIQNSIGAVESKMGFTLDNYDTGTNKAKVKDPQTGQIKEVDVDLPGVSLPMVGRVTAYDQGARELDTAMSRVFNVELKDRSGAAVTTPELERLKIEFGSGKFNSEAEKLGALKEYKRLAGIAMRNVEAGYSPRAVQTYGQRGGMTSQTVGGGGGDAELQALLAEKQRRAKTAGNK
jgi:hypothetical protein